mmetsp:Transcript_74495/g.177392  ORF Transcript_74495/g.177392 Transcript_74495/m.177392 type:complete len:169 (-) Transcript_74495:17-523(-)
MASLRLARVCSVAAAGPLRRCPPMAQRCTSSMPTGRSPLYPDHRHHQPWQSQHQFSSVNSGDDGGIISVAWPCRQDNSLQVQKLLAAVGKPVCAGEELVVLGCNDSSISVPAPYDGIVRDILKFEGEVYFPGDVLVKLEVTDQAASIGNSCCIVAMQSMIFSMFCGTA